MKRSLFKKSTAAALLSVACCAAPAGNFAFAADAGKKDSFDALLTIDASRTYQTIDNFGASDAWSMDPIGSNWTEENKTRVADLLFSRDKGIGLSAWRFNIGAGSAETDRAIITNPWRRAEAFKQAEDGAYDWSKQAGQQWFLNAAKERGVDTLIGFVNSPPVWMTKNGHAQPDQTVGSTNLKDGYEDEFADYLADVLEHFQQEGLRFDYISPINEPTWDWNKAGQEGNRYNNDDMKRVVLELYRQLQERGLETQISAPDGVEITALLDDDVYKTFANQDRYTGGSNSLGLGKYREYIKDLLGDPALKEAVGNKIASHSYWSDYSNPGDDRLGELRDLLHANLMKYDPQAKYWMSEYCILGSYGPGRDLGIDPALHIARTIHFDLTRANASAWQWWTAVSKEDYKDGLIYTDYNNPGDEQTILPSKMLWALGNYSKFIRPGAERIALTGLDEQARSGLFGSAYRHAGEDTVTAVFVNDGAEDKRVKLSLGGLDKQEAVFVMKPYVTSSDKDLAREADIPVRKDGTIETVIPARSVVTLSGDVVKANKKPDAPEITAVKAVNKGLQVEFKAPKGAYEYEVRYGTKHDAKVRKLTGMSEDAFVLHGLKNGERYFVTVRARNGNGYGPQSHRAYGTPALLAPAGVKAEAIDGGFAIAYDTGIGVPAYRVRYGTQPGKYDKRSAAAPPNGTIRVEGLANGTIYYGVLEAVDGKNVSPPSAEFRMTPDIPAPSKLIVVPGDRKALITFAPVEGAVGYFVQAVSGSPNNDAEQIAVNDIELNGLTNGSPVVVRVATVGQGGKGTGYAEAEVTPGAGEVRFEDDFNSGDLSKYNQDLSQWTMEDGLLKHGSASGQGALGVRDVQLVDGTVTAVAKHASADADWGIAFRGGSYSKGYLFGYENGLLFLRRDGQHLQPPVPFTAKPGEYYKLEVRLNGKQIEGYLDGERIFAVTDTVYKSGRIGLHSWSGAGFDYLGVTRDAGHLTAKPEIYEAKEGDGLVALHYREVDGADGYIIRYAEADGSGSAPVELEAAPGSAIVTGLANGVAYTFSVVAIRGTEEAASAPAEATPNRSAGSVVYYVDAGDGTPGQLEDGEGLGALQSQEDQEYGSDPVTGVKWGYEADNGLTWAHTSPTDAYETIRQYDGSENGKGLAYRFQLPNGTYKVTVGFFDPWNAADRVMQLTINGETKLSEYVIGSNREAKAFEAIEVTNGELVVKAVKAGGSKPMMSWIKIEKESEGVAAS
ncbi:glycoside hydrolase [Paenibacillus arenilitoris]|uniref:Fibronectin type III domain-containing protein n=1 Tax=Paenibacillus arenilitoris TaxID=2772299 RepID=A0A927CHH7_9BACL|nr:glycoside hydrolase [Paenibacillus arenilitoris]MBD2867132.1 fibronectin type III domain-containing protein [Paenibacillus arenilitoris]